MKLFSLAISGLLLFASTAFAHHNEANTYTRGQRVQLEGKVTFVSWDGAHVMYRIDVPNPDGSRQAYEVLGGSPFRLAQRGINKHTVRAGDVVGVAGYLNIYNRIVTPIYLSPSDGSKLFVGYVSNDVSFRAPPN
jgi:hypothetical protein